MKRPWQFWSLFAACLFIVLGAMGWLTVKVNELARAEAESRRQEQLLTLHADFEGDVRLALRRIDLELAEIFAQESAWPHFAYQAFYIPQTQQATVAAPAPSPTPAPTPKPSGGKVPADVQAGDSKTQQPIASPLLKPPVPYVNLYFHVDEKDNDVKSPNVPPQEQYELAATNGWSATQIENHQRRLEDFQGLWTRNDLASQLPEVQQIPSPREDIAPQQGNSPLINNVAQVEGPPTEVPPNEAPPTEAANQNDMQQAPQGGQSRQQKNDAQSINAPAQPYAQRFSQESQVARGNLEYQSRKRQFDRYVDNWNSRLQQRDQLLSNADLPQLTLPISGGQSGASPTVLEGRSRAMWVDSQLLLARRLVVDGRPVVQGCWMDWPAIKQQLGALVADLLPGLDIVPVHDERNVDLNRMLATLPAQLVAAPPELDDAPVAGLSPVQLSLIVAWSCVLLAALAVAMLLAGVLSLSERRAAFVSAVTHELRTPLTTFRMYAEMLAEGMVPDESRRKQYLATLKSEADRLFHLVENVLSYARLERGRHTAAVASVDVGSLVDGMQRRLEDRAAQGNMQLDVNVSQDASQRKVHTDASAVEQIVINLVDNACKYAAATTDRKVHLEVESQGAAVLLMVRDHGPGIEADEARHLFQPFTKSAREAAHTAPGVGLGLALCQRLARQLGGKLWLESSRGDGACFVLKLPATEA